MKEPKVEMPTEVKPDTKVSKKGKSKSRVKKNLSEFFKLFGEKNKTK